MDTIKTSNRKRKFKEALILTRSLDEFQRELAKTRIEQRCLDQEYQRKIFSSKEREKRLLVIVHFLNQKLRQANRDRKLSRGSGWYIVHPKDEGLKEPVPVADENMPF